MLKRLGLALLAVVALAWPVASQIPGGSNIVVDQTPVTGGTTTQCLYITSGHKVGSQSCGGGITIGTTTITSGTSGRVLYDNAGVVGELAVTGSGNAVLATSPALTAPTISSTVFASMPTATANTLAICSDCGPSGMLMRANGTRWKPASGCAVLSSLDSASSNVNNNEAVVHQVQLPTNLWQVGDRLRIRLTESKSGTTDTGNFRVRIGTAGTTGDTQVALNNPLLAAANRVGSMTFDIRLDSATSAHVLGNNAASGAAYGYSAVSNNAFGAGVTISNASSNSLFVSITLASSSTNDTVALQDAQIDFCATAN